jgi:hypothetical protein
MIEISLPPSHPPLEPLIQEGKGRKIFALKPVMKAQRGAGVLLYTFINLGIR